MKRIFDCAVSACGLMILGLVLLLLGLLVWMKIGSPVLFRQQRPGLHGKAFELLKFRTMTDARDSNNNLLPDSKRLTGFGRFLRKTSLDELPELWNVLKGDMSLVGPRPLLMQYLARYTPEQARRHEVKPGMTGWAQVNGRNALTWEEKFKLDVWYVDHQSFWLDVQIIAMTVWKVLRREGISQTGQATAEEFMGGTRDQKYGSCMKSEMIAIYGASGFGREVAWLVESCQDGRIVVCFMDDDERKQGTTFNGIPVVSLKRAAEKYPAAKVVAGIGSPRIREKLMKKTAPCGFSFGTLVHPRVEMSNWVEMGDGVVICAGNILTTNIRLGKHVQINLGCTIGHDVVMGDYATLAPGVHISGWVHIGKRVYIGTGAVIINGTQDKPIIIGDDAVIGAGACVTLSIPEGETWVGVPAKVIKPLPKEKDI